MRSRIAAWCRQGRSSMRRRAALTAGRDATPCIQRGMASVPRFASRTFLLCRIGHFHFAATPASRSLTPEGPILYNVLGFNVQEKHNEQRRKQLDSWRSLRSRKLSSRLPLGAIHSDPSPRAKRPRRRFRTSWCASLSEPAEHSKGTQGQTRGR